MTDNESILFTDYQVPVYCANGGAGDVVTLNGRIHLLFTVTANKDNVSVTELQQPQDLRGTDTEGRAYRGVGAATNHVTANVANGVVVVTSTNNFSLVGIGAAPSYVTHVTIHVTSLPAGASAAITFICGRPAGSRT